MFEWFYDMDEEGAYPPGTTLAGVIVVVICFIIAGFLLANIGKEMPRGPIQTTVVDKYYEPDHFKNNLISTKYVREQWNVVLSDAQQNEKGETITSQRTISVAQAEWDQIEIGDSYGAIEAVKEDNHG